MRVKSLPLLALLMLVAGSVVAADWPQWRGPERNDVSKEKNLLKKWPEGGPKLLWTFDDAGTGMAGPAIVGDRLYSMGADESKEYVFAVDLNTRKKLWTTEIGPRYVNGWTDGPRSTPTVDGDRIYALGGQGDLVCVKAADGKQVWMKRLKQDLDGSQMSGWGYTESPLVDGDQVAVTPGGKSGTLAALDKMSGEVLWRTKDCTDAAGYSSLVVTEIGGQKQYVQMTGVSLLGVAAADGKLLWRFERKSPTAAIPTPIVDKDYVFTTSGYGAGCALVKIVASGGAFKAEKVYDSKDMTNHHGETSVVKIGDYVYGHSDKGGWTCMEFMTGKVKWAESRKLGKGSGHLHADGHLYCYAEKDGTVALIEATPEGFKEAGLLKIPRETKVSRKRGKIWTHPVVANGKLYLRDQDLIFCFDVSDGKSS